MGPGLVLILACSCTEQRAALDASAAIPDAAVADASALPSDLTVPPDAARSIASQGPMLAINGNAAQTTTTAVTLYVHRPYNLLLNEGAEAGTLSSWSLLTNGGDGWAVQNSGLFGTHSFTTSYTSISASQEVDLLAKGFTATQLDAAPMVVADEWYVGIQPNFADKGQLDVVLLNAMGQPMTGGSKSSGALTGSASWQNTSIQFSGYGTGLRYIRFIHSGQDVEFFAGHYGMAFDGASLVVAPPAQQRMRFSNDGATWGTWIAAAYTAAWTLSAGAGAKTVYVQFDDGAGTPVAQTQAQITLQ